MAWDRTKPANNSPRVSSEIRSNWDALARTLAGVNLLADPTFLIWPAGDTVVPAHFTLTGTPTIARAGTGLADTNRKIGAMCVKLTGGAGVGSIRQNILPSGAYDDGFDGLVFSCGAWVWASVASAARIGINDGISTTYSDYHTGNSTWQWLALKATGEALSHTVASTANSVIWLFEVAAGQTAYVSGPTVVLGEVPPLYFQPAPVYHGQFRCFLAGSQTVGNRKVGCDHFFERPTLLRNISMALTTGPVPSTVVTARINHWDGATMQPVSATNPTIPGGAAVGSPQTADAATYRWRCFEAFQTNSQTDRMLTVDITTIGAPNPGVDLTIFIRYIQFERPLEAFLRGTDTN